ncbi:hypothetical protein BpHYR1_015974 [Brachionus plicatilis]|uniref:Uncharacterized protein n=1 Tax=Brachionus plicatilis TaxID=10195 RepID=A0A3M7T4Z4_BRAPC|nr:hypothetical protein BpHYR1_015974 [Brachionus plicatilis]
MTAKCSRCANKIFTQIEAEIAYQNVKMGIRLARNQKTHTHTHVIRSILISADETGWNLI